jgi:hypothetical protein
MVKLLPALAGAAMLAAGLGVANADEIRLTPAQMDTVTAGWYSYDWSSHSWTHEKPSWHGSCCTPPLNTGTASAAADASADAVGLFPATGTVTATVTETGTIVPGVNFASSASSSRSASSVGIPPSE